MMALVCCPFTIGAVSHEELMNAYTVVFEGLAHLGPGNPATTRLLAERLAPGLPTGPRIADLGCGVGAAARVLARSFPQARVLALDLHAPFIARLKHEAEAVGLGERICPAVGDMSDPPTLDGVQGEFDLIWSESAIYSIGRSAALKLWRPLLKPGGWLIFSDVVWRGKEKNRSTEASSFWNAEYPDISTPGAIIEQLKAAGFKTLDPVSAGREAWANYYEPLRERLHSLGRRKDHPQALIDLLADLEREIEVYDRAGDEVAVTFFLARKEASPTPG